MDNETKLVFRGFVELNHDQQNELIRQINNWRNSSSSRQSDVKKSLDEGRVVLGPIGGDKCPCCGR